MANKDAYEEQMDRREFRRKRRIRNQIISYIVTVIVLAAWWQVELWEQDR